MMLLSNLEIGYVTKQNTKSVYKSINAQFKQGDLIGLVGNNGVGKSTLLKTITGNLMPLSGTITIQDKNITSYSVQQLAQLISIVITEKVGGFNLTVWDVVATGRTPYINVFAKLTETDNQIITDSLELLQINELKHCLMDELSDGQRQKVMIAKALAQQTPIIVLDEPTAFLDYQSKHLLFKTLKALCTEQQKLIIVSSHDIDLLKNYTTQFLEL